MSNVNYGNLIYSVNIFMGGMIFAFGYVLWELQGLTIISLAGIIAGTIIGSVYAAKNHVNKRKE